MTFSYTQIAQYLRCPKSYRYRYLDGWREKENKASLLFGRAFEKALAAFFLREDSIAVLYKEWGNCQEEPLEYSRGDSWDRLLRQGVGLLETLARDNRIQVPEPHRNLQVKLVRPLSDSNDFLAYVDAIGTLDGQPCILEWKTTTARYPQEPAGLVALDLQLNCYSWISGIPEVAIVAFVRKRTPEIQYLKATISDEQRRAFDQLVATTSTQICDGQFLPRTGIRFPQNGCVTCAHLGLCLNSEQLVGTKLLRSPGASDLDWLDHLDD